MPFKVLFMGTPGCVLGPLSRLAELSSQKRIHLLGAVSQPARPKGRKRILTNPPVAEFCIDNGIPLFQPEKASSESFLATMKELNPDVVLTAAFGQILTNEFLAIPKRATINIHPSILPKYRGATPVAAALLNGDKKTGVSILFTVKKVDAGAIIVQGESEIEENETCDALTRRLFDLSSHFLPEAFRLLENSEFQGVAQDENQVSHCTKIKKEDGEIDWNSSCFEIRNRFRAFHSWPGSYTHFNGQRVLVNKLDRVESDDVSQSRPGRIELSENSAHVRVTCSDGFVYIQEITPAGKSRQEAATYFRRFEKRGHLEFGSKDERS